MSATESHQFSNIAATTGAFGLMGGEYGLVISATWNSGSAQLETLADDGATWINVGSSITSATAVYAALTTIPKGN